MKYWLFLCIFALSRSNGQSLTLTLNPLSPVEDAYGLGVGYQWNPNWQVWLESSILLPFGGTTYNPPLRGGFREILAVRRYVRKRFFVGGEVRLKFASYTTVNNTLPGAAVFVGSRFHLSGRFFMEWNLGPGLKYREVSIKSYDGCGCLERSAPFDWDPTKAEFLPYVSAAIRFGFAF